MRTDTANRGLRLARWWIFLLVWSAAHAQTPAPPVEVDLARNGEARLAIVVAETATEPVRQTAAELAGYLQRISGAAFEVKTGNGTTGIAVGAAADFPALTLPAFESGPFHKDDYLLRSHAQGVWLIGATPPAAELAVWDFLHRLGYRLFFLTDTWEVVPRTPELKIAIDTLEIPDYTNRLAPRGAPWSDRKLWDRWKKRNRVASAFALSTGHAYDGIISRNKAEFEAHPEYLALVGDKRGGNKFCIANPGLRKLVVDYAVRTIEANPAMESISMEPSDGGGWCQCEPCAAMGSVSDRVTTLANEVAVAINALGLGPKYVGFYAYNEQSPPPTVAVHPMVVVSLATSFIRGGYTIDQMVEGWRAKGALLGIRDYHDVFTWSHDLPRRARGGDLAYLARTIPHFHANGARFMNSENGDSWGANGLGYWITTRLLWDTDLATRLDDLVEDFLDKAFGPAKEPMRHFFHLINQDKSSLRTSGDVVGRMYRHLAEAAALTEDPAIRARLDDLILYTRYVELYHLYRAASGEARQAAYEAVWRHAYRIRGRMMLSTVALCSRERFRDKSVATPAWSLPEEQHPWKNSDPFTAAELATMVTNGIAANDLDVLNFTPVSFSEDLVPARPLGLPEVAPGTFSLRARGLRHYQLWFDQPGALELRVTGGLIAHYRDRGNVKIRLHSPLEVTLEPVAVDESVPPDGKEYPVVLKTPYSGLHTLELSDGSDQTELALPEGVPLTIFSSPDRLPPGLGTWSLYFYVPKQTRAVGGYTDNLSGAILDGEGQPLFKFADLGKPGYFSVPVPPGQDGKLWKFDQCSGRRLLMSVPPCLARSEKELLLPREVVTADAPK